MDANRIAATLALAWLAAARPALAAIVEETGPAHLHVDAAAGAGVDLDRLIIVRPPPGNWRSGSTSISVSRVPASSL
jgi:hypothetical protein